MTRKNFFACLLGGTIGAVIGLNTTRSLVRLGEAKYFPNLKRAIITYKDGKEMMSIYIYPGDNVSLFRTRHINYSTNKYGGKLKHVECSKFEQIGDQLYAWMET